MWLTRNSREHRDAQIGVAAFVAALLAAIALISSGMAPAMGDGVRDARDSMRLAPATGNIVVVEIDGRSLQALDTFPWPRSYHASAVRELDRLGASQVAFDIDFSARSDPEEDEQFAAALAALDQPAILATFRQYNFDGETQTISEAVPIQLLRENSFMASVNVHPSSDGRIIDYPYGITTNGTPRPSLANMLARTAGEIDSSFRVDQAIDMRSIPRVSFIDLIEGRVPRSAIAGKQIVIGATAIELGDRYPTSLFGVQPGVLIHVQAAETLIQGRDRGYTTQWLPLLLTTLALGGFILWRIRKGKGASRSITFALIWGIGLVGLALAFDQWSFPYIALVPTAAFLVFYIGLRLALVAAAALHAERMTHIGSGLPNRTAMLAAARRKASATIAVARFPDFGEASTLIGEVHARELDLAIARRLTLLSDVDEVYQLGNGLFGWFVPEEQARDLEETFASARALFTSAFEIARERLRLKVHFGSSTGSVSDAEDASELARRRGSGWSANAASLHEQTQFSQRLLGELDEALANGAISVVFQPKLRLSDGAFVAGECLVRWESEQLGRISPSDFIPILEQKGRIDDLTLFVLEEAIRRRDEAQSAGYALDLSVNVSAQLLTEEEFITAALDVLRRHGVKALGGITLEITESAPLVDSVSARAALEKFGEAGARISIDDYGTGQASLNYLQDFPAQEIKLDQSFVRNFLNDRKDQIMVESTIKLAHALGFEIVAEGIEDASTLAALSQMGCDYGQGWEIGHPVPWDSFAKHIGQKRRLAEAA